MAIRSFKTAFAPGQLEAYQQGALSYRYRDLPCLKSPIDIAIYLRLLHDQRPATLFEIGAKDGGSALMFRDFTRMLAIACEIISIDLRPPRLAIEGVRFLEGDVRALEDLFGAHRLERMPRPWMVIEDSAHTRAACQAALEFFAGRLHSGEYLVIEDGVLADLGLGESFEGGPNRAISDFFAAHPDVYEIDARYCDMFGPNATYNPNGYLRKR
jgi:cephalosporin hydroxylase